MARVVDAMPEPESVLSEEQAAAPVDVLGVFEIFEQFFQTDPAKSAARARIDRIKAHVAAARDDLVEAWHKRDWLVLGYASWDAMCEAEFDGARISLPMVERRELVGDLRAEGLSTRAIASGLGVSHQTVANDLNAGVKNLTPEPTQDAPATAPKPVVGLDGKTYRPVSVKVQPAKNNPPVRVKARIEEPTEPPAWSTGKRVPSTDLAVGIARMVESAETLVHVALSERPNGYGDDGPRLADELDRATALMAALYDWLLDPSQPFVKPTADAAGVSTSSAEIGGS